MPVREVLGQRLRDNGFSHTFGKYGLGVADDVNHQSSIRKVLTFDDEVVGSPSPVWIMLQSGVTSEANHVHIWARLPDFIEEFEG